MKPTWLLERGVYREHATTFKREVERQGMVCAEVDYRPGRPPPEDIAGCPPLTEDACGALIPTICLEIKATLSFQVPENAKDTRKQHYNRGSTFSLSPESHLLWLISLTHRDSSRLSECLNH